MLDPTKPYVEKIHYIDAELAGHVDYINLKWNGSVCVGVAFLCLLCAWLPNLTTLEWIDQQHFAKTKMAYISLTSDLNAIIGIKSYYFVILKMVILRDAMKTIQNSVFVFFPKKSKNLFLFKKTTKKRIRKQNMWIVLFQTRDFSTHYLSTLFFVIFTWSHDLEQVTSLSVWLGARCTLKV